VYCVSLCSVFAAMCTSWMLSWLRVFLVTSKIRWCFFASTEVTQLEIPACKKDTQFFFLLQCQEYKYSISKDKSGCSSRVRPCWNPCLIVRNPYLIWHARPTSPRRRCVIRVEGTYVNFCVVTSYISVGYLTTEEPG
jgi:hypothetical protein